MDEWVDRSKIHTSHTYTIILCFFWTLASASKQPVQVSKDSSAAFFSIFALHARRPQQKTGKIFVMGSLQKSVCTSQAPRLPPLPSAREFVYLSTSHSSAEAAPFSGEETTPSPVQTPVISSDLPTAWPMI